MKKINFVLTAVAAIATVSCVKEIAVENTPVNLIPMTFTAGSDNVDTKIALQEDQLTLHWENTDQIKVFDGKNNNLPAFTTTESGPSVDFTGEVEDAEAEAYYALYPYQADAEFGLDTAEENRPTIYAEVPAVQYAVAGNVPSNAFIAAAKSDNHNNFSFSAVCGYIKFTLNQDNVKSITFSGNNNESLTGKIKIYFDENGKPLQTYVSGGVHPTVTLTGDLKNGETYYAAVRGNSFSSGITISLLYNDGTRSYATSTTAPGNGLSANSVMKIVAPASYNTETPADKFIAYIHGYDINLPEGVSYKEIKLVDKTNGSSKLISYIKGSEDRIIFVSGDTDYEITAANGNDAGTASNIAAKKHIAVIGRYEGQKPTIKMGIYIKTQEGSFLMRNITVDASELTSAYLFNHSDGKSDFGEFIIDGCWIKGMSKKIWQNAQKSNYGLKKIVLENNRIEICANNVSLYNFYSPIVSANMEIRNNVFYGALDADGKEKDYTGFKVVNQNAKGVNGLELDNIVLNSNTFVNVYFVKEGYISANKINKAEMKSNLLYVPNYYTHTVNDKGALQYWGILYAAGRKGLMADGSTAIYDEYEQYADETTTEITKVTAKVGANPNYYPASGMITVKYNTSYRIKGENTTNIYPKASFLDLKERDGVFCPKGTYYPDFNQPSAVEEELFSKKDFAKGIFIQAEKYADKGANIAE